MADEAPAKQIGHAWISKQITQEFPDMRALLSVVEIVMLLNDAVARKI